MTEGIAFQTRARTIDHLGRGQIADAPTAISELWKNAYDAYARNVALHIFDGEPEVAAIFDDGIGMNREDVVGRWLVIGTESKIDEFDWAPTETLGLPVRPRQGEKGIGRLSVAFLAPATILVSKRRDESFVAVIVDWRLFENPFLSLEDVRLPVAEFKDADALANGLSGLIATLASNLGDDDSERSRRLIDGWERYSIYERRQGLMLTTKEAIAASWERLPIDRRHLEEWPVFLGLSPHGTAMFMPEINRELAVWVRPDETGDEVDEVKEKLRQTLTAFTDPYSADRPDFDYEIVVHRRDTHAREVGASDVFGIDGLHDLEHYVDGGFDERGVFSGRVVAFGQDLGIKEFVPRRPPPQRGRDRLGAFRFAIGTYEIDERKSTLTETHHATLDGQAAKFAGVSVYRDFLRVMPYGRPDADFLGMEQRRGKSAGREFWAHRRSFGRIGISRSANPSLRDKAGREGLIDNRAFREMRLLVIQVLMEFARRYFGSASALRQELLPGIMERKALQREAADAARARRRRGLRQFLREQAPPLGEALQRTQGLVALAEETLKTKDRVQATVLAARAKEVRLIAEQLRPPTPPARLGEIEDQWRAYRDGYEELTERLQDLAKLTAEVEATMEGELPLEVLRRKFEEQQAILVDLLRSYDVAIQERLAGLRAVWDRKREEDAGELMRRCGYALDGSITSANLLGYLNLIEVNRSELVETLAGRYPPFLNTLDQLVEGIDLEGAYSITEDDRLELEEQLRDLRAVAQVGVTVEIIGHEFETLESEVRRNLAKLPASVRDSDAFRQALRSHQALADRLRFLTPMKIGGYRARERITGEQISGYIEEFFGRVFRDQRIEFIATTAFRAVTIIDIPSRIFPVFLNLVNNAVYWVSQASTRTIKIDLIDGLVIVADSGPGVDPEDVSRLFELFFTRRRSGRGVGLYLSRVNLAVAGHKIRYANPLDPKVLDGANFIIEFKGVVG